MTNLIDYKKVFSKLSHIKALAHDQKFDQIVQQLIVHALINEQFKGKVYKESEIVAAIFEVYGISIRLTVIQSNTDKLISKKEINRANSKSPYSVDSEIERKILGRITDYRNLEDSVKQKWFDELKAYNNKDYKEEDCWNFLQTYFSLVFQQHGAQSLSLLNPSNRLFKEEQQGLYNLVEAAKSISKINLPPQELSKIINDFIQRADEYRVNYLAKLVDATFTSYALTSDSETVNFLNQRYKNLNLYLDTNFIFGILNLHNNNEDSSAKELLDEIKRSKLPFKLGYHSETLNEFRRVFNFRAMQLASSKWDKESSRVALSIGDISPLEILYHRQNVIEETDPRVFLDKYNHVEDILKDLGLIEFLLIERESDEYFYEIEKSVEEYDKFYNNIPNRKIKSFSSLKHDMVVLREVRMLNPSKKKFLDSQAFFISSDYILAKFEKKKYVRNYEIGYVISPSLFLQLIRPFIENNVDSNRRFIDTFKIPEFRSFEIDYSSTKSKALQLINDNYHDASFETKVKILRDQVILEKLENAKDNYQKQIEIIENRIAIENGHLNREKEIISENLLDSRKKIESLKHEIEISEKSKNEEKRLNEINSDKIEKLDAKIKLLEASKGNENKYIDDLWVLREYYENEKIKNILEYKVSKRSTQLKLIISLLAIIYWVIIVYIIYKYGWNNVEPYFYAGAIFFVVLNFILTSYIGDNLNPLKLFPLIRSYYYRRISKELNFDLKKYNELEERVKDIARLS